MIEHFSSQRLRGSPPEGEGVSSSRQTFADTDLDRPYRKLPARALRTDGRQGQELPLTISVASTRMPTILSRTRVPFSITVWSSSDVKHGGFELASNLRSEGISCAVGSADARQLVRMCVHGSTQRR